MVPKQQKTMWLCYFFRIVTEKHLSNTEYSISWNTGSTHVLYTVDKYDVTQKLEED